MNNIPDTNRKIVILNPTGWIKADTVYTTFADNVNVELYETTDRHPRPVIVPHEHFDSIRWIYVDQ